MKQLNYKADGTRGTVYTGYCTQWCRDCREFTAHMAGVCRKCELRASIAQAQQIPTRS